MLLPFSFSSFTLSVSPPPSHLLFPFLPSAVSLSSYTSSPLTPSDLSSSSSSFSSLSLLPRLISHLSSFPSSSSLASSSHLHFTPFLPPSLSPVTSPSHPPFLVPSLSLTSYLFTYPLSLLRPRRDSPITQPSPCLDIYTKKSINVISPLRHQRTCKPPVFPGIE